MGKVIEDNHFQAIVSRLERCSKANGGCESCPMLDDCLQAFDLLSEQPKPLSAADFQRFQQEFAGILDKDAAAVIQ